MDPRIAWIQPELFGPPTEFWQRLWERSNQSDEPVNTNTSTEAENDQKRTPNKTALTEAYRELQAEKQARLARELNIGELSPLSRGPEQRSENAAGTSELDYQEQRRNHAQNGMWRTQRKYPGGVAGLHLEIVDFYNWIKSTPEEYVMRYDVVNRVELVIKHVFPNAQVEVFGSFQTGLYLPTSDIDMVVLTPDLASVRDENPFYKLHRSLIEHGVAEALSIKVIDRAAVPIVKMRDMLTDIKVDISFNMKTGVESVSLIKEFIREFPALQPLVLLLKHFLLQRDLNEVWTGGISSYGLILMTVSFLQMHEPQEKLDLGQLLIDFFDLYGRKFNYNMCTIRVKDGGQYIKKEEMQAQMEGRGIPSLLSIEDPLTPSNDIGRSSYGAAQVRSAFEYAYRVLCRAISPQASYHSRGPLSKLIVVTEQVAAYRAWVHENWRHRVPRLEPIKLERPKKLTLRASASSIASGDDDLDEEEELDEDDEAEIVADQEDNDHEEIDSESSDEKKYRFTRRVEETTREWDEGKQENFWDSAAQQSATESRSSGKEFRQESYDHDFPVLRDRDEKQKKKNKKEELSEKESIADSDISLSEPGKKKTKPRVNVCNMLFKTALDSLGTTDRIHGKDEKRGKRPTMQRYTPKGSRQNNSSNSATTPRKSPRGKTPEYEERQRRKQKDGNARA